MLPYGEEQQATNYRRCGPMTMSRRFCCNDLLRLGPLDLEAHNPIYAMYDYMMHLGMWPANCYVTYSPGGQITEYIFGRTEGRASKRTGYISMHSSPFPTLNSKLTKLLEDSCDKIYNAYTIRFLIPANDSVTIKKGTKAGYDIFRYRDHDNTVEMIKPLPRLMALAKEKKQEE